VSVVSVLRLPARPGVDLAGAFAELEVFEHSRRTGGFLGGRLLRELDGEAYLVIAEWEDAAAYQGWLDSAARAAVGEKLDPLMAAEVHSGELYEEV
jgi:heme-degrading monooxygenase HmoA